MSERLETNSTETSTWNWRISRDEGIWRFGAAWWRPLVAVAPWLTVGLAIGMMVLASRTLALSAGELIELPVGRAEQAEATSLVAVVKPVVSGEHGDEKLLVFFDDARYVFSEATGATSFQQRLAERITQHNESRTLLIFADNRVSTSQLLQVMEAARLAGVQKVQMAERRQ